ncbi:hypothetical protein [Chitinophaga japonensis]|uniref:Uncharacterized protein n=1 Tax=Chitinophaga japonensis TaxID=104662 RepID=A0A562T2C9_CHIJA|nr:hypothetical protein [Chitinophaga japonensis]TWI87817.1 hypothetical protein LX66_1888 [Chitinophaga japonensis]
MKKGYKYAPETLLRIRRMRKARRLYRQQPVFAYSIMSAEFQGYSHEEFWNDLRRRTPPKKRKGKSGLRRYGRYGEMCRLLDRYRQTGNVADALKAQKLRNRITQPYRLQVRIGKLLKEYLLSPLIPVNSVKELTCSLHGCKDYAEADNKINEFLKYKSY